MRYEELQLTFEPVNGGDFAVRLRSRLVGDAEGTLRMPFEPAELPSVLAALVPPGSARGEEPAAPEPMAAEEIGARLFDGLFAGKVGERFAAAAEKIEGDAEAGLRIELGFDLERPELAPLAALPWELLYRRERRQFLALGAKTPVVRRIFVPRGVRPPLATPLRLLTAWSDAKMEPRLDVAGEFLTIEQVLSKVPGLSLSFLADPEPAGLRAELRTWGEDAVHMLHWIGHGKLDEQTGEGMLIFSSDRRAPVTVSGRVLADHLQDCDELRLVVLSACEGGRVAAAIERDAFQSVGAALVLAGVPAVIAMQMSVRDSNAIAFTHALYTQLALGLPLEAAMGEARLAVHTAKPKSAEFAVPVLFLRQGDMALVEPLAGVGTGPGAGARKALSDFRGLIAEKTRDFAGRRWLFDRIDAFAEKSESGYFLLRGDPGIGKTAVVAKLAQARGYPRYFNQRQSGNQTPGQFLRSLCTQLIAAYGLARSLPPEGGDSGQFLMSILDQVSGRLAPGERAFFLVDALDEADTGAQSGGSNLLYLPPILPAGVFALVTARRGEIPLRAERIETDEIVASSLENRADVTEYLERAAERPGIAAYRERRGLSIERFVADLAEKSEGNFMYLRYVLPEIEAAEARGGGSLDELPQGLANYYDNLWRRMKTADEATWYGERLPVLAALSAAREPLPFEWIGALAGVSDRHRVRRVLDDWAPFLSVVRSPEGGKRYRLYHASFHDFIAGKDQIEDERVRLAEMNQRFAEFLFGAR
ncbi:MAG: CHAT domain-containing protein [Acidobacteriota bacterium]